MALTAITREMQKTYASITTGDIKKKIETIRNQYRRDMLLVENSRKSGARNCPTESHPERCELWRDTAVRSYRAEPDGLCPKMKDLHLYINLVTLLQKREKHIQRPRTSGTGR